MRKNTRHTEQYKQQLEAGKCIWELQEAKCGLSVKKCLAGNGTEVGSGQYGELHELLVAYPTPLLQREALNCLIAMCPGKVGPISFPEDKL